MLSFGESEMEEWQISQLFMVLAPTTLALIFIWTN
jgi:hypothetical protein